MCMQVMWDFSSKPSCLKPRPLSVENIDLCQWSVSMAESSHVLLRTAGNWWRVSIIMDVSESQCSSAVSSNRPSRASVIVCIPHCCLGTRHGDDSADWALLHCANSCLAEWYMHIPPFVKKGHTAQSKADPDLPLRVDRGMQHLSYMWCKY